MEVLLPLLLSLPPSAWPLIWISVMISILSAALSFMSAYFFQSPQMVAIAKEEFAAVIFTIFIIVFWVSSDAFLNGVTMGLLSSTLPPNFNVNTIMHGLSNSHIQLGLASLEVMDQKLRDQYIDLYLFEALIGFLSTVSFPLGSPIPAVNVISFSLAPFTGLALLSNTQTMIVEAIGYMVTLIWAKEFILLFARDAVPTILLPLGLVMRAFPFYRKTGSSIIALAFALYFVFPYSVLLSNYLIFDVFQPSDFAYTPASSSFFGTEKNADDIQSDIEEGQNQHAQNILDQFTAEDAADAASDDPSDECTGNAIVEMLCSLGNIISGAFEAIAGFIGTVVTIWRFMMGMTGDFFFTAFNNPLMPSSASAGLYYFLIEIVTSVSPFIILIMFTTVVEIIFTVTMYRNFSILIGGEAELIGMTKIV